MHPMKMAIVSCLWNARSRSARMKAFCKKMIYVKLILLLYLFSASLADLSVATYNLWNVMFNWHVRKYRIARMIKNQQIDVMGFQEVRSDEKTGKSQLDELKGLMPQYKWSHYHAANTVSKNEKSILTGWEREGIGILSKYPIESSTVEELPYTSGPDKNRRILLHAKIQIREGNILDVIVVHLSYIRQQQCENVAAIMEYIQGRNLRRVILLGDFNVYTDFEGPIQLLTIDRRVTINRCKNYINQLRSRTIQFQDTWSAIHRMTGYTFSNMPKPGLVSRPDRILASMNLLPQSAFLSGDGSYYKAHYLSSISYQRFKTLLYFAYLSNSKTEGYSCLQDCGPNGSCRCGVCVRGGNHKNCMLPDCPECNGEIFHKFCIFVLFSVLGVIHLFYSILTILITGSDFRKDAVFSILGCNCCLCNPKLFRKPDFVSRRHKLLALFWRWPPFRLPPYVLLALSSIFTLLTIWTAQVAFSSSLDTINSIMDEEFFPSDHLLLEVKLKIT